MNPVRLWSHAFYYLSFTFLLFAFPYQVYTQPLIVNAGADKEIMASQSTQIGGSPTASGGVAPYFYLWSPNPSLTDPTSPNPVSSAITTTTYIVTVTDATGATATDTVTIFVKRFLYAVNDNGPAQLSRVDIDAALPTLEIVADYIIYAGPAGYGLRIGAVLDETEAAALDVTTGIAYIISNMGAESALLTIDLETGYATGIGFLGTDDVNSLAFDPLNKQLYGVSSRQARLYKIDILTGVATALPNLVTYSHSNIEGLSFDYTQYPPALYGIDEDNGNIFQIDTFSGAGIVIGQTMPTFESIEFGGDGTLYAASNLSRIFIIDRTTFQATEFADHLRIDGEGLIIFDGKQIPDTPIPVELSSFSAVQQDKFIKLHWTTASETENLGFHIFRRSKQDVEFARITKQLINGAINSNATLDYTWTDSSVVSGEEYTYKLADINLNGIYTYHNEVSLSIENKPSTFALYQNYPNPFLVYGQPTGLGEIKTTIQFQIAENSHVQLQIFNIKGQLVKTLLNTTLDSGKYPVTWDGNSSFGIPVPSGIYIYRLSTEQFYEQKLLTVIR